MSILEKTVYGHSVSLRAGEYSAEELTRAYLDCIEKKDGELGAYLFCDPESALKSARRADNMLSSGNSSVLCGIPMALKDNICTAGIPTTCASKMLEGYVPPYSAFAAELLENAGCVLLGKTNMDEFAMGSSTENSAYKITRNPHAHDRSPGGSSGGSAAAVASCEAVFSLGSDTGGSVRQPAALCGVVGIKPTRGAVSRSGLVAFASSFDQIGPVTRDVRDNAIVLSAIAKPDRNDATCRGISADLVSGIEQGVKGIKIGILRELWNDSAVSDGVRIAARSAAETFRKMGAEVLEISVPSLKYALSVYHIISSAEASSNLARFDGIRYGYSSRESAEGVDDIYVKSRSEGFGSEVKQRLLMGTFALSAGSRDKYYEKAQVARRLICRDMEEALRECSLLISPMTFDTAPVPGQYADDPLGMYLSDVCGIAPSITGLPAISVPCGCDGASLPVGLQIIGGAFCEPLIYRAAFALERGL